MGIEIEAKMKVDDFDAVRRWLRDRGAQRMGTALEANQFFDTPDSTLLNADKGLRLRTSRDLESGKERHLITVKGPQQTGQLKSREEAEAEVCDAADARRVLLALGYEPTLCFEKRRESWELGGCKVELDELPILGRFVEIEGPDEQTIMKVREMLGLSDLPPIRTGYITMLWRYLAEHNNHRKRITFLGES